MIIDCISDLHGHYPKLEGGDLLIVAGDLTATHTKKEFVEFVDWYIDQNYTGKVLISGNHDIAIQNGEYKINRDWTGYLCDSGTEFGGLKIWGSPWTLTFPGKNPKCTAFNVDTEAELARKFMDIPKNIDILITHSPPYRMLDECMKGKKMQSVGSKSLMTMVMEISPKLHIFGHIHEQGGRMIDIGYTKFINCSHVNEHYEPVNKPIRVIL